MSTFRTRIVKSSRWNRIRTRTRSSSSWSGDIAPSFGRRSEGRVARRLRPGGFSSSAIPSEASQAMEAGTRTGQAWGPAYNRVSPACEAYFRGASAPPPILSHNERSRSRLNRRRERAFRGSSRRRPGPQLGIENGFPSCPPELALDLDEPRTVMGETFGPRVQKCASRPPTR